ncbi:MAG: glycosyltransferase family 2 protein [Bacilli bacterium]|jgi:hypothetical protein
MKRFDIPVVLFTFKRSSTVLRILDVVREVAPSKIYLFSDGPRNEEESKLVLETRKIILAAIDWPCEVIRCFEDKNTGVFNQIGLGALQVFKKEERAIFLEDDNLPTKSFFEYARLMLERYRDDDRVLWICGTSYFPSCDYLPADYVFTKHMLPCGWASWANKFSKYYQTSFKLLNEKGVKKQLKKRFQCRALYRQQLRNFKTEKYREEHGMRFASWDYHMAFSIRYFDLYGIAPKYNQITNIGVDDFSTHGGTNWNHPNTDKFCGVSSIEFTFPLHDAANAELDDRFEKDTAKKILVPLKIRIMFPFITLFKKVLGIYPNGSLSQVFRKKKAGVKK